jgi:hypothetical protein
MRGAGGQVGKGFSNTSIVRAAAEGSTEATMWASECCGYPLGLSKNLGNRIRVKHHDNDHADR